MNRRSWVRWPDSFSDNRKSKIENLKWMGVFAIALTFAFGVVVAHAQTPFYQGKTITIVVGYLAGDGYNIWARLLAAHMVKHIAGNPNMIAQNMPGGRVDDHGESYLQRGQAGRFDDGVYRSVALSRSIDWQEGSAVRLGKVRLGGLDGEYPVVVLHEH